MPPLTLFAMLVIKHQIIRITNLTWNQLVGLLSANECHNSHEATQKYSLLTC